MDMVGKVCEIVAPASRCALCLCVVRFTLELPHCYASPSSLVARACSEGAYTLSAAADQSWGHGVLEQHGRQLPHGQRGAWRTCSPGHHRPLLFHSASAHPALIVSRGNRGGGFRGHEQGARGGYGCMPSAQERRDREAIWAQGCQVQVRLLTRDEFRDELRGDSAQSPANVLMSKGIQHARAAG